MFKIQSIPGVSLQLCGAVALVFAPMTAPAFAQDPSATQAESTTGSSAEFVDEATFNSVASQFAKDVRDAEAELAALRARATEEILAPSKALRELQKELVAAEAELASVTGDMNQGAVQLLSLTRTIEDRRAGATRLTNLFLEYVRKFKSRVHISELQLYDDALQEALLAPENSNLTNAEIYDIQSKVIDLSMDRLSDLGGGKAFDGAAVDSNGIVREGRFVLFGPTALFRSRDGSVVGTVTQRTGSAAVQPFGLEEDTLAAAQLVETGSGVFPLDASLGNAFKVEATKETFQEHIAKGGAIMFPLLGMGALAFLVALYKWLTFLFVRSVSKKKMSGLLEAVSEGDEESAARRAKDLKGPVGEMLQRGVGTMRRSRDLMEEVMYERVIVTKSKLQSMLPFIGICAASAPLLGLLGTVTGIINTFTQITIFGSGDVKQLSGGISEALITTKFGLIVAIPSLLLHAYLSRKARGVVTQMEASAVQLANEVAKSDRFGEGSAMKRTAAAQSVLTPSHDLVRGQVTEILSDMLGPLANDSRASSAQALRDAGIGGGAAVGQ